MGGDCPLTGERIPGAGQAIAHSTAPRPGKQAVVTQAASLKKRLKQAATVAGMSESEIVGKALNEELAKNSQRME